MMSPEQKKIAQKLAQVKYRSTSKAVETRHRRRARPEVRAAEIKSVMRYNNSAAGSVKHKMHKHRSRILRTYGITLEQYDQMLLDQNGLCAVCHKLCRSGKKLSIDHNHDSGVVRGLLCSGCNLALGSLMESAANARSLADYIDNFSSKEKSLELKS